MREIKNIDKISLAKIMALIYGLIGFFMALIIAIPIMANVIVQENFFGSVILIILLNIGIGLFFVILSSLLTALFGWIFGYIIADIYNRFAEKRGGIKIELTDVVEIKSENNSSKIENNLF